MRIVRLLKVVATAAALSGASMGALRADDTPAELRAGMAVGYLKPEERPDSVMFLPPPPALGSAAEAVDQEVAKAALALQGSDRFKLATIDADLTFPNAAGAFTCVIGAPITAEDTPTLFKLLHRAETDAGAATAGAKDKYSHARPFMLDSQPTCTPKAETALRSSGSYPSGHTSIGWAWAEILAEIAPDRADAILARGRAFGESRLVCNVHWASDVDEGRVVGAATVVRLHANAEFRADLQAAQSELQAVRDKGLKPQRDCDFEAQALKSTPWLAP